MEIRSEDMPRLIAPKRLEATKYGPSETEGITPELKDGIETWRTQYNCIIARSEKYPDIVAAVYTYGDERSPEEEMRMRLTSFMHTHIANRDEQESSEVADVLAGPNAVDEESSEEHVVAA